MKKTAFVVAALCGLASVSLVSAAADAPPPPPRVLQIFRETVKPGHAAAHAANEAGWPAAFAKVDGSAPYIALTSTSGPNEAWFITGFDSYAAYEKDGAGIEANAALQAEMDKLSAADGDHLSGTQSILASYREDLSYRPAVNVGEMRYFNTMIFRVKPGHAEEFAAARKMTQALHEKLDMNEHWAMYQVTSGMPTGTFIAFLPIKSMADLDAAAEMHGDKYMADESHKKIGELTSASLESTNTMLLRFSPKMSYPPRPWVTADAAFWAPKAAVKADVKMPATKKKTN